VARANGPSRFRQALAETTPTLSEGFLLSLGSPASVAEAPGDDTEVSIAELWLDDQPRLIVPEETLTCLIAADRAQPAALLEALQQVAVEQPYFREVLARIEELASSIRANGVLTPLLISRVGDRLVVRDGHRRALASLLAERPTVPARIVAESSGTEAVARALVVNLQRENLTAIEKGRWLLRLARLVEQEMRAELDLPADVSVIDQRLADGEGEDGADEDTWRRFTPAQRDLARRVQQRVCGVTGLGTKGYYGLLRLNRLSREARAIGLGLSEGQLQPATRLPAEQQAEIVAFIARRNLGVREAGTLVQVALSGDRDAVRRVMSRLSNEASSRRRVTVSWETLLYAVPKDVSARCESLHAELRALPEDLRTVRLQTMRDQARLARELARQFDEIVALFGLDPAE
jgi:hypothetical protein